MMQTGLFDRTVWAVMALLVVATALVIGRGDRVGVRVVALSPEAGSSGISPQTHLRIRFDQPLIAESLDPAALRLEPPAPGELRAEGSSVVFVPHSALAPDTTYRVHLETGLRSRQGRSLLTPLSWEFRTGHTSVLFSAVDERGREQLWLAPITLAPDRVELEPPRRLGEAPFGVWDFAVDPGSGQIVYSMLHEDGTSDLWTLNAGASAPSLLLACPSAACSSVAFSPDSRLLAYSQRNDTGMGVAVVSPPRLRLMDLATGETSALFSDSQQLGFDPRWSADGQWLSYLSPNLIGVGVYHLESGAQRFYATSTGEAAVWHPRQNRLVLSRMEQRGALYEVHLYLVDPADETPEGERGTLLSLHDVPVEDNSPAWSPDGEWLAFRRKEMAGPRESLGKQLWVMRSDGSAARPLTIAPAFDHGPPAWSPDGRYLLYHKFPLRGPDVTIAVWVLEVATGREWEIARPGQRPQWVP